MDVGELSEKVRGAVLQPRDEGYAEEVATFNLAFAHSPDVVVAATCAEDVAAAMRWAGERALPVGVQATGHGPGTPITHGVLVSTKAMLDIEVDPGNRTARVGPGVRWRALLDAAAPYGLSGLCGSTSDVGVIGYTLGGGLPVLGRRFGYAADHVRSFEVVTGDGEIRQVDVREGSDLAWALRGGKGNVGIVTSMVFDLVELSDVYGGGIFYDGSHAAELLTAYARWVPTLPETFASSLALLRLPPFPEIPEPLRGQFVVHLRATFVGVEAEGARILAPMRAAAPVLLDSVEPMPYAALDRVHQDPDHPVPANEGSSLLRDLPAGAIDVLLEHAGPESGCPLLSVELRHLGGALSRPADVPDALGDRDAAFALILIGMMVPPVAEAVPTAIDGLVADLAPYSTGRSMVNLHGVVHSDADRARPWTAEGYARLQRVKAAYDPDNLLRFGHAVAAAIPVS
ncbi:MAG TPA: FAD-binding oxidoreductase [Nocardioidaceae bacterium]|nr:FAD-binding oxidoreductase [Nocardioidaceae bacterium]